MGSVVDHRRGYVVGYVADLGGPEKPAGFAVEYPYGAITEWNGQIIGKVLTYRSWPTPRNYVSSRMYQIEALIDGVIYTGRSGGSGLIWKGKKVKGQ